MHGQYTGEKNGYLLQ